MNNPSTNGGPLKVRKNEVRYGDTPTGDIVQPGDRVRLLNTVRHQDVAGLTGTVRRAVKSRTFEEKIRASAAKRTGEGRVAWLRSQHVGPTGKPYTIRRLGLVINDTPTEYARCDRRGYVYWHTISYGFTIESESDAPPATPETSNNV